MTTATLYTVRVGRGWLSYSRGDRRVTQDVGKAESWASLENATHAAQRWTETTSAIIRHGQP